MNVLLFPSAYQPSLGGVEELSRQLAIELVRYGHRVTVMTNRWPRSLPQREVLDGVVVHRPALRTRGSGFKSELSHWLTKSVVSGEVRRIVHETCPDVVHVICVWPGVSYALETCATLSVPIVTTLQGELTMDATRLYERSKLARDVLNRALRESASITSCSAKTLADAVAFHGGTLTVPSRVIFNGARVEEFTSTDAARRKKPYVLAIGRLVPQKGFDVLLHALAQDRECLPTGWELLIAGDGPDEQKLRQLAKSLGISECVQFVGRADRTEVPRLMRGCEFLVVPSRADEGLPVVCAEGAAAGRAVIGTRRGGIPEIVLDGETGIIIPDESSLALASAIRILSYSASTRHQMGDAALKRSAAFSWRTIMQQYLDVYHEAIDRKNKARQASAR